MFWVILKTGTCHLYSFFHPVSAYARRWFCTKFAGVVLYRVGSMSGVCLHGLWAGYGWGTTFFLVVVLAGLLLCSGVNLGVCGQRDIPIYGISLQVLSVWYLGTD